MDRGFYSVYDPESSDIRYCDHQHAGCRCGESGPEGIARRANAPVENKHLNNNPSVDPILVTLEKTASVPKTPETRRRAWGYTNAIPAPRDNDCERIADILAERAAEIGEEAIEEWGHYDDHILTHQIALEHHHPPTTAQNIEIVDQLLSELRAEFGAPDFDDLLAKSKWLSKKAQRIRDCGKTLLALVRTNPALGEAEREVGWQRCRERGCPFCGWVDGHKVIKAVKAHAQEMVAKGYVLRVVHLTTPGDYTDTLSERSAMFKGHLKTLRDTRDWRRRVQMATVFHEAPWNVWRSKRRVEGDEAPDDDRERHHWHWHAHALVWFCPGEEWAVTDQHGFCDDGTLSPLASAWYRSHGLPEPSSSATATLRLEIAAPYAPADAVESAAANCAVAYAAKYAAKGTGSADAQGATDGEYTRWVEQSRGLHFQEVYGKRHLTTRYAACKRGDQREKVAIVALLDELESGSKTWTDHCAQIGADPASAAVSSVVDAGLVDEVIDATYADIEYRRLEHARDCFWVLKYYNGEIGRDELDAKISAESFNAWNKARKPEDWEDICERNRWKNPRSPYRARIMALESAKSEANA